MSNSAHRPHTATVRLTPAQHKLARARFLDDPGMTFQKLYTAVTNAYIKGELAVNPDGTVDLESEADARGVDRMIGGALELRPAITYEEDPDALSLEELTDFDDDEGDMIGLADLESFPGRPHGSQATHTIGTRELAKIAEGRTGRRVNLKLLRQLIRERFRPGEETGPGTRYRWQLDDPEAEAIVLAIADGALEELRHRRLAEVALADPETL